MTREGIQGFIDGFLKAGGKKPDIQANIIEWMDKHPTYPQSQQAKETILSDLESYRGVVDSTIEEPVIP